jgi:hypothetical protein
MEGAGLEAGAAGLILLLAAGFATPFSVTFATFDAGFGAFVSTLANLPSDVARDGGVTLTALFFVFLADFVTVAFMVLVLNELPNALTIGLRLRFIFFVSRRLPAS